ncbi:MAG TPA: hypothetical protein VFN55_09740 [Solirubrobacteraceae bacterium]|nr:hypothetical protein [Solirubrobacteraceae bacterium]
MSGPADLLQGRAEILKLARLLGRDPAQFAYLETVALDDLRALREQTVEVLWNADAATMSRLAAASRLLPVALTATIAQRAFGPLLAARMAGHLEPERAVDVAAKLPTEFLAEVASELDPRRSSAVLALIPSWQVAAITRRLVARGEQVTMGRFVGHLGDDAIRAALAEMDDPTLLRVGFVLEDKRRLPHLLGLLAPGRLDALIATAAEHDLWIEALDLLNHLDPDRRSAIVASAITLDDAALEAIIGAVIEHQLWDEALIIAEGDAALQAKLAERLPGLPRAQRRALARRASQAGGLDRLGPFGAALANV